jgi:uncharacterized protein DUF6531
VAGLATVSADGRTITTDPGVGIPKFCCGAAVLGQNNTPGNLQPGPTGLFPTLKADPVDLSTGIFMLSATDLVIGGRTPLAITRSYRSGDTNAGVFGLGTMMGYDEFLQTTSATVLTYVYHGDTRTTFVKQADGSYTNSTVPALRGARITVDGVGNRTLRYKDGRTVAFTGEIYPTTVGLQTAVTDANGNALTVTDPAGNADPLGDTVTLGYDAVSRRRVTQRDPLRMTTAMAYDVLNRDCQGGSLAKPCVLASFRPPSRQTLRSPGICSGNSCSHHSGLPRHGLCVAHRCRRCSGRC